MFALTMLLLVIAMICVPIGVMKFPWTMRSYASLSQTAPAFGTAWRL